MNVRLRLRDPVVGHHLLELILVARKPERVRARIGRIAGLAVDRGVIAVQEAAAVKVRECDVVVRSRGNGRVGVLLIGQRLVAKALYWIRNEDRADTGRAAGAGFRRGCRTDSDHGRGHRQQ